MSDANRSLNAKKEKVDGNTQIDQLSGKPLGDIQNERSQIAINSGEIGGNIAQTAARLFASSWSQLHDEEVSFTIFSNGPNFDPELSDDARKEQQRLDSIRQDLVKKFVPNFDNPKVPLGRLPPARNENPPPQTRASGAKVSVGGHPVHYSKSDTNSGASRSEQVESTIQVVPDLHEFGLRTPLEHLSFQDGVLALSSAARRNADDPQRLAALLVHQVGPFLATHVNQLSGENLVDGAINILSNVTDQKMISAGIFDVVPVLRAHLDRESSQNKTADVDMTEGEIVSLAAIATLLANSINGLSQQDKYESRSIVYYHEVLLELLKADQKGDPAESIKMDLILKQAINNIAAAIGRIERRPGQGRDTSADIFSLLNDLMKLAASIVTTDRRRIGPDLEKVAKALGLDKEIKGSSGSYQVKDWFGRLSAYEMVSYEHRTDVHGLLVAWRHAATGMLRAANGEGRIAPAALFNGGVQLLRGERKNHSKLRIILNGCGVIVAFKLAKTDEQALIEFDGDDCTVNLLGAISTLVQEQDAGTLPAVEIVGVAASAQALLGENLLGINSIIRIENSVRSILDAVPEKKNTRRLKLADATLALLRVVGRDYGIALGDSPNFSELAGLVRAGFKAAAEDDHEMIVKKHPELEAYGDLLAGFVIKTVQLILDVGDNPLKELNKIYRENRYGEINQPVAEIGPLVAAGLSTVPEWNKLCMDAKKPGDFREVFRNGFGTVAANFGQERQPVDGSAQTLTPSPVTSDEPGARGEGLNVADLSEDQLRQLVQLVLGGRAATTDDASG